MIVYFAALGSKKENGKKKKKIQLLWLSTIYICRITLPESACTISRVIPSQERPSLTTRSIYPISFRSTVVMRSFVATYLKTKGFCVFVGFFFFNRDHLCILSSQVPVLRMTKKQKVH